MKRSDFHFQLPDELIARYPTERRSDSRLLHLTRPSGALQDLRFYQLPELLNAGDLLVFNNTRVIPARLFGYKDSGGKVEILIERLLGASLCLAHVRASKAPKPGRQIRLESGEVIRVEGRRDDLFELSSADEDLLALLQRVGHMPLPPYIDRQDQSLDQERYQTVYAQTPGAVAAPTAGLHFDQELMERLHNHGVNTAFVTLHVGAGTFQPVRVEDIRDHNMHSEWLEVTAETADQVLQTRRQGGRVIAVGTTAVRCLETAAMKGAGEVGSYQGETDIFIYPGYSFQAVDGMITNFHLPESTLIMLVSAFAGKSAVMQAYAHAVAQRYRFFSYGDAMFIS